PVPVPISSTRIPSSMSSISSIRVINPGAEDDETGPMAVIALRPPECTRSRAFGQLRLVAAPLAQHRPEEACAIACGGLDISSSLSSYLVLQQLLKLAQPFNPYRGISQVTDFLDRLDSTAPGQLLIYQWLGRGAESSSREVPRKP